MNELLKELEAAHQIIRNALAVMTPKQKSKWGELNARDDVDGEGITRANERMAVIAKTSIGGVMAGTDRTTSGAIEQP